MKDHLKVRSAGEVIVVYVLMIGSQMIALTIIIEFLVTCNKFHCKAACRIYIVAEISCKKLQVYMP